jgi:Zn-dependent protease
VVAEAVGEAVVLLVAAGAGAVAGAHADRRASTMSSRSGRIVTVLVLTWFSWDSIRSGSSIGKVLATGWHAYAGGMDVGKFYVGHLLKVPVYIGWEAIILVFFAYRTYSALEPAYIVLGVICLVLVILLHELGHALVARALKTPGVAITISAMGGYCSYQGQPSPGQRIPITAAGPLTNFLCYGLSWAALSLRLVPSGDAFFFVDQFSNWSLFLGTLNSFPLYPLDGGQFVLAVTTKFCQRVQTARRATLVISVIAAAAMFSLMILLHYPLVNVVLIIALLMVAFTSLSS